MTPMIPVPAWQEPVCDWTSVPLESECKPGANNNLLDNFYLDPARWGLTFQQYVIFSRVKGFYEDKENNDHG
jgi:deoxyadenosine/deoxycytidine kinase